MRPLLHFVYFQREMEAAMMQVQVRVQVKAKAKQKLWQVVQVELVRAGNCLGVGTEWGRSLPRSSVRSPSALSRLLANVKMLIGYQDFDCRL